MPVPGLISCASVRTKEARAGKLGESDEGGTPPCPTEAYIYMDIVDRLLQDRPIFHDRGTNRWDAPPDTLRAIQETVQVGNRTLETGCGASTVVFIAQGAHHTAIAPHADEHEQVRDYLKKIDIDSSGLTSIVGSSDLILPDLCRDRFLDAALIDGAHAFPYPAVDWHYITSALKIGGKLFIDDIPIPAVADVFRFMESDPNWRRDAILDEQAAAFSLICEPHRPWNWTLQSFNRRFYYGFIPLSRRIRRQIGQRYPGVKQAWKWVSRASRT
jgi:hypothetical protein